MRKWILVVAVLLGGVITIAGFIVFKNRDSIYSYVGSRNYANLEKIRISSCIGKENDFHKIRRCLDSFDSKYLILGDSVEGNFKVVFIKPFAEAYIEVVEWKISGGGAGITEAYENKPCFLHLSTTVPILSETEKVLLKLHFMRWVEKNPEAFQRYVTKVEETATEVVIYSQPLARLKDYVEYCEERESMKYLDVYKSMDLDEIAIKK
jgi:hypothetical protein